MDSIDLRSDTVTWPTPEMREVMARAEVGDDVWGDDTTTQRLEALAAERMGKEAGLFVASGTMGNLIALLTHCGRGEEMIVGDRAHTVRHEVAGAATLGGVPSMTVPVQPDGTLKLEDIRRAIRNPKDIHEPPSRLVELENTQGDVGGVPLTAAYTIAVRELCDAHGLKLHLDGARIWNAAAALDVDVLELAAPAHSVTFCLSKGLCAPAGSVLCGDQAFIERARRLRKMLGGGMRQTGILAAAGILAIEQMTTRLGEDHATARALADGLDGIDGVRVERPSLATNMVFFELEEHFPLDAATLCERLATEHNVKLGSLGARRLRAVTHYWIDAEHVPIVVEAIAALAER